MAFRRCGMARCSEQLNQIVKGPAASKRDSMMVFDDRGIGDASRVASRRPQDSTIGGHRLPRDRRVVAGPEAARRAGLKVV